MISKNLLFQKKLNKTEVTLGIFEDFNEAVAKAEVAQKTLIELSLIKRSNITQAIRNIIQQNIESLAYYNWSEASMGNLDGKISKHHLVVKNTLGVKYLQENNISLFNPYGVILSFIPSTNASETLADHTIGMIAAGNSCVFCPNPRVIKTCKNLIHLFNKTIIEAGGPENLITLVDAPRRSVIEQLMQHPSIKLIVATGSTGIVNAALASGKKAICAGSGNPPIIVDEDADLKLTAESIIQSIYFEFNILCINEKEAFVLEPVYDEFISVLQEKKSYLLSEQELEALCQVIFTDSNSDEKIKAVKKEYVGQSPQKLLQHIGVNIPDDTRLLIAKTVADHPVVLTECMIPLLPIVKVSTINEAIAQAVIAEGGRNHSASIYSNTSENIDKFRSMMPTTVFSINESPLDSFPHFACTIATTTGEGFVCAKDFVREG